MEALIREIENKENEILSLVNTLLLLQKEEKNPNKTIEEIEESSKLPSPKIYDICSLENLDLPLEGVLKSLPNISNISDNSQKSDNKVESENKLTKSNLSNELQNNFIRLQYAFSQFGRVVHYLNIINFPNHRNRVLLNTGFQVKGKEKPSKIFDVVSSEDIHQEEFEDEEEEKIMSSLLQKKNIKKKIIQVNFPLTLLAMRNQMRSDYEENMISQSKKKKSLEVYFKWKLKKWDQIKKPFDAKKVIFAIPCRICLTKVWNTKLAVHSKYCLQRSQISHELENQRKNLAKHIEVAVENKRNIDIKLLLEKFSIFYPQ